MSMRKVIGIKEVFLNKLHTPVQLMSVYSSLYNLVKSIKTISSCSFKVISSIHFLVSQGLALREYLEDVNNLEGNFYQL